MKNRLLHLLAIYICVFLSIFFLWNRWVFAASDVELDFDPEMFNTQLNIKWALLIEKYLIKYNQQLADFKETHAIQEDTIIDGSIESIKNLIFDLRKIQTDKVEKEDAEKVMEKTIDSIKTINKSLKVYLKNKAFQVREDAKLFQEKLVKIISPFQKKLEKFIQNTEGKINANGVVSKEEKRVIRYLDELENENIKLKTFRNINFRTKAEIKSYIIWIIINIQKGMSGIKTSL